MRGVSVVITAVLIFLIALATSIVAWSWAAPRIAEALDIAETKSVRLAFERCAEKIIFTARTGTTTRCLIPAERGRLTAAKDGLYYQITSTAALCDPHTWIVTDPERHIQSRCDVQNGLRTLRLRWFWPAELEIEGFNLAGNITFMARPYEDIEFSPPNVTFRTLTVFIEFEHMPGAAGQNIKISRVSLTPEKVILRVDIY